MGMKEILQYVEEMQLRWYGHVKRMPDERLPRRLLYWQPNSTRPPGRPRKHWIDNIQETVQSRGSTMAKVKHSMIKNAGENSQTSLQPTCEVVPSTKYLKELISS